MIIAGSGSAGIETLGIILRNKNIGAEIIFYDESNSAPDLVFGQYPVIKNDDILQEHLHKNSDFTVTIGNTRKRQKVFEKLIRLGGSPKNIISDRSSSLTILPENAAIIQPGVVLSYDIALGISCMIHANTVIGHKVTIGDFVSISPLVSIVGPCEIGNHCFIGAGSVILPHLKIGNNVIIPAGSVVNSDISDFGTFNTNK